MTTKCAPNLSLLAESAFRFHVGLQREKEAAIRERVNALCAQVNARPDCDDIYANLPIWDGELSGQEPTYADLERQERYLTEKLEVG